MSDDSIMTCPHCGKPIAEEQAHIFTQKEIKKMDLATYEKNRSAILGQMASGELI